jgi:shikimate kinase
MTHVVLIGYRCTGKTTVGRCIAERAQRAHFDADAELEKNASRSIQEIFAQDGESHFRDLEIKTIEQLVQQPSPAVISLGGGAVLREENRVAISSHIVVWLMASSEAIWERMNADATTEQRRPALTDHDGYREIVELMAQREPLYRENADYSVETVGKSPDEIADEIVSLIGDIPAP